MRKRSGALHSQSEEEFLLLAELSHEKTGYFYDEKVHAQLNQQLKKKSPKTSPKQERKNDFSGFEFSSDDLEKQEEARQLSIKNQSQQINLVLVCVQPSLIKSILLELYPIVRLEKGQSAESRLMDLFVVKIKNRIGHQRCFKFWIIASQAAGDPLYSTYLRKGSKVLNFSPKSWTGGQEHSTEEAQSVLREILSSLEY